MKNNARVEYWNQLTLQRKIHRCMSVYHTIVLEHGSISFTESDMHVESIIYHDTQLEMFHAKLDRRRTTSIMGQIQQ